MLQNLHVKNLALINETEVEFKDGLNILSGETGAGKSIIIGSINLALGEKVQKEMLRDNADTALVELVFYVENPAITGSTTISPGTRIQSAFPCSSSKSMSTQAQSPSRTRQISPPI